MGGVIFADTMLGQNVNAMPVVNPDDIRNNVEIAKTSATQWDITGSCNGFQSWKDFSLNPNEVLNFSGMTNMLNYVPFKNPSLIYGTINAPNVKNFYIINPSGILFGPNSKVVTGDFFVSTRSLTESDISTYLNNGKLSDFGSIDATRINNGGLKSSEIMGAYDIADGDVMFLGKVQANSLKVEGNTIQIRNTANITKKDGTNKLTDVTLYSNNSPEIGYKVTTSSVEVELDDSAYTDYSTYTKEQFINSIAYDYDIYLYKDSNGTIITETDDETYKNNVDISNANYEALGNLYDFYQTNIATKSGNDKVLALRAFNSSMWSST